MCTPKTAEDKLDKLLELQHRALPAEEKCSICGELSTGKIAPVGGDWMGYCDKHKETLLGQLQESAEFVKITQEAQRRIEAEYRELRAKLEITPDRMPCWMRWVR